MAIGVVTFVAGYTILYWGTKHFGLSDRYSLWCLLGIGSVFKSLGDSQGQPLLPMGTPAAGLFGSGSQQP